MKLLVITTSYPKDDGVEAYFVHTRNLYYVSQGIDVTVLNFATQENYYIDGIKVISLESFDQNEEFDILVSHAPNLRNHYKFLNKFEYKFKHIVFFFHGHEVLIQRDVYPKPYDFVTKDNFIKQTAVDLYDSFKIKVWKKYILKNKKKLTLVFVSKWMQDMFLKFSKINFEDIKDISHIIYNSIGKSFEGASWNLSTKKDYDVITIRGNLDGSKYCIDLINELAKKNPNLKFKVFGKGKYFEHNEKATNIDLENRSLKHTEIIEELNKARVALLPTRTDAQGVMACEMQAVGIPLVTSDIPVCSEVFGGFKNIKLISNSKLGEIDNFEKIIQELEVNLVPEENKKYFEDNTISKEVKLFEDIDRRNHG